MHNSNKLNSISRRAFVKGGVAAASVASFGGASLLSTTQMSSAAVNAGMPVLSQSLVEHLCTVSHSYLNDKLTKMVADPNISNEETSMALRSTRCPYCDTQISASYPVVPLIQAA